MTQRDLITAFQALGCTTRTQSWDAEGNDGNVVTTYGAIVSLSGTGTTVARTVRTSDDIEPGAVVAEMRRELAGRARTTRAAIRRERKAT